MAVEDMTHENYWRRLLRWLVDGVPDPVEVHTDDRSRRSRRTGRLTADVVDARSSRSTTRSVVAQASRRRAARSTDVPMQWTGERNGEYRATFVPVRQGMYTTAVEATRGRKALGAASTHVRAAPGDAEYFDATMHARAAAADRRGNRRPVLHAGDDGVAAGGSQVHRPRRHDRRRARALAHADRAARCCCATDVSPSGAVRRAAGAGVKRRAMRVGLDAVLCCVRAHWPLLRLALPALRATRRTRTSR